jgi:hypothetical protein
VVVEYETTFKRRMNGTEVVIPTKEGDGEWRVSVCKFKIAASNKAMNPTLNQRAS